MQNKFAWEKLGLAIICIWFIVGGIFHFLKTEFFVLIVPPYIPYPYAAVYISGGFEIIGAISILMPRVRPYAGLGLILLTLAVTPANIYMWQNPFLFPNIPPLFLSLRLVLQVLLVIGIAYATHVMAIFTKPVPLSSTH
ncbi:MAG: hypothetical protein V4525_13650 [Pseudomonadota bacterium]